MTKATRSQLTVDASEHIGHIGRCYTGSTEADTLKRKCRKTERKNVQDPNPPKLDDMEVSMGEYKTRSNPSSCNKRTATAEMKITVLSLEKG